MANDKVTENTPNNITAYVQATQEINDLYLGKMRGAMADFMASAVVNDAESTAAAAVRIAQLGAVLTSVFRKSAIALCDGPTAVAKLEAVARTTITECAEATDAIYAKLGVEDNHPGVPLEDIGPAMN